MRPLSRIPFYSIACMLFLGLDAPLKDEVYVKLNLWVAIAVVLIIVLLMVAVAVLVSMLYQKKGQAKEDLPGASSSGEPEQGQTDNQAKEPVSGSRASRQEFEWEMNKFAVSFPEKDRAYALLLKGVVNDLIDGSYDWGISICSRLDAEKELVGKYFHFLHSVEYCYTKMEYKKAAVLSRYDAFMDELHSNESSAKEEYDSLQISADRSQRQVRMYFILPMWFNPKFRGETFFNDFVNLDTLYSTIASYRSEKGRYGQKVEDLRKNKPVLGLISLIGLWTSQQRQIQKDTKSVALMSLERAVSSSTARKSTMS